jgi:hypothetical protein
MSNAIHQTIGEEADSRLARPTQQHIELEKIQDLQRRGGDTVERYAAWMRRGDEFPPIEVVAVRDGTFVPLDGYHRIAAARLNGSATIEANVFTCPGGEDIQVFIDWLLVAAPPDVEPDWLECLAALDGSGAETPRRALGEAKSRQ